MKLKPQKTLCILFCLTAWTASFSQTHITLKSNDSIALDVRTDTANKKVFVHWNFQHGDSTITDSFALIKAKLATLKDSAAFYASIKKYVGVDSVQKIVIDTVRKLLSTNKHFSIQLVPPPRVIDPPNNPSPPPAKWWQILLDTTTLLVIFIILLIIIVCLLLAGRNLKLSKSITPIVPNELIKLFPGVKNGKDLQTTVRRIQEEHGKMDADFRHEKQRNEELSRLIKDAEEKFGSTKQELEFNKQALEQSRQAFVEAEKGQENFKNWSDIVLEKYFTALAQKLEQNQRNDEEEVYKLILTHLIPFALHSASILKKHIKEATELDSRNIQLLNGEHPNPTDIITDNTQWGHTDPLAYYLYKLLKKHQVEGLEGVFVKGYKIGK